MSMPALHASSNSAFVTAESVLILVLWTRPATSITAVRITAIAMKASKSAMPSWFLRC